MTLFSFNPRQEKIISFFEQSSGNICEASLILMNFLADPACPEYKLRLIKSVKKRGDKLLSLTFSQTGRQFVLPFDAEDILMLALKLNLCLQSITLAMEKIICYQLYPLKEEGLLAMINISDTSARNIYQTTVMLRNLRSKRNQIRKKCEEIILNKALSDNYCLSGMGTLLNQKNADVLYILKLKEIYISTELINNSFYDISNIIKEMTVKYV